jgi:hypothetical protein
LRIDTTGAKINLFFDDTTLKAKNSIIATGNQSILRVDCRVAASLGTVPVTSYTNNACTRSVPWVSPSGDDKLSFQSLCSVSSTLCPSFDSSELLNVFASSLGTISLNGNTSSVGMNIYAPKANVTLNGGGSVSPNYMGRLWTDGLKVAGGVVINTYSSLPSFCGVAGATCPTTAGLPIFDFKARSFTTSSGF